VQYRIPIEMPFEMLSPVGPGNMYGDVDDPTGRGTSVSIWSIEKHCYLGLDKRVSYAKLEMWANAQPDGRPAEYR